MEDNDKTKRPVVQHPSRSSSNFDYSVMRTAQDAVKAKHAAVQAGYYRDPFIGAFSGIANPTRPVQVIIKRGTFARVYCVYHAITAFCEVAWKNSQTPQVIVLGAGKDTSFFRLLNSELLSVGRSSQQVAKRSLRWAEVDHEEMVLEKMKVIRKSERIFSAQVGKSKNGVTTIKSSGMPWPASCHLCSYDLNQNPQPLLEKVLNVKGWDATSPTLLVLECVQMYMPVLSVHDLLQGCSDTFSDCHTCSYEPILGQDAFGEMMERNLSKTGVVHPDSCMVKCRTLPSYLQSFVQSGFSCAVGCDMNTAFETLVPVNERQAANQCEFLDELEEWMLIMRHYCFVASSNNLESAVGKEFCRNGASSLLGFQTGRCEERVAEATRAKS